MNSVKFDIWQFIEYQALFQNKIIVNLFRVLGRLRWAISPKMIIIITIIIQTQGQTIPDVIVVMSQQKPEFLIGSYGLKQWKSQK